MEHCVFCQAELDPGTRLCRQCGRAQPATPLAGPPRPSGALSRVCPTCGQFVQPEDRICLRCSSPLWQPCQACGHETPVWARFCPNCAHSFAPPQVQPEERQERQSLGLAVVVGFPEGAEAPGMPSSSLAPQIDAPTVPSAPAGPQGGMPRVPSAPIDSQSGISNVPSAPTGSQGAGAVNAAGKAAGRFVGSRFLNTAIGKVVAIVGVLSILAGGSLLGVTAAGKGPFASQSASSLAISPTATSLPAATVPLPTAITTPLPTLPPLPTATPTLGPAGTITEFPLPTANSGPFQLTAGPDGNLWFYESNRHYIGRITPAGVFTEFQLSKDKDLHALTAGPDGNVWFTEDDSEVGRMTPAGKLTEFAVPTANVFLVNITAGPDGNLWFDEVKNDPNLSQIGRITPAGIVTEFPLSTPNSRIGGMTAGPDGNLWFTDNYYSQIDRMTPAGVITTFPAPEDNIVPFVNLGPITTGPDGNLWFAESDSCRIGRITPAGEVTVFPQAACGIDTIVTGPDGNLWFADSTNWIDRMTPDGTVTEFSAPTPFVECNYSVGAELRYVTAGPDRNLWFTEPDCNKIVRITA